MRNPLVEAHIVYALCTSSYHRGCTDAKTVFAHTRCGPKTVFCRCAQLILELNTHLAELNKDPSVGAIVLTGDKRAFAAGADIKVTSFALVKRAGINRSRVDRKWRRASTLTHFLPICSLRGMMVRAVSFIRLSLHSRTSH